MTIFKLTSSQLTKFILDHFIAYGINHGVTCMISGEQDRARCFCNKRGGYDTPTFNSDSVKGCSFAVKLERQRNKGQAWIELHDIALCIAQ